MFGQSLSIIPDDFSLGIHSYEKLARYVMPQFQGSVKALNNSMQWSRDKSEELQKMRTAK